MRSIAPWRAAALAVGAILVTGSSAAVAAQELPGGGALTLAELLARVEERNPQLQAMRAGAQAAALRRPTASTLPDPVLQLGVMNVGVPGLETNMPSSMVPSVQLMQMVPFPGKLGLMGEIASLDEDIARSSADEMRWEVREMAAGMFYELYALDRRTEVMRETLSLLSDFQQVARAMYASGMGRQADVLRAEVEVARMDGEIRTMEAMRVAMAARLNGLLDLPAETPVPSPTLGRLPAELPSADTLRAWAADSRPLLAKGRRGVDRARSAVTLAKRELWPDVTVGLSYGQRPGAMGTERMGSAMIGFSLPVFASRRQYAMRDEAMAMERMAEAELGSSEAEVGARVGELLAELERARSLTVLYRDEVLPQARATVQSAFTSYRVGNVDFMTLVDAQMTVNQYQGELFQLLADYGKALAALESTVGQPIPDSGEILSEVR